MKYCDKCAEERKLPSSFKTPGRCIFCHDKTKLLNECDDTIMLQTNLPPFPDQSYEGTLTAGNDNDD